LFIIRGTSTSKSESSFSADDGSVSVMKADGNSVRRFRRSAKTLYYYYHHHYYYYYYYYNNDNNNNNTVVNKTWKLKWTSCSGHGEMKNAYKILVANLAKNRLFRRKKCK
jgi:hypothetical protein